MDTARCLGELRVHYNGSYEEYLPYLKKCSEVLKKEVACNPQNIKAVCLLSMVEFGLRKPDQEALGYLHEAYKKFKDVLSIEDLSMLLTDIAYFYSEEECGTEVEVIDLLQQAINIGTPFAETFYGLALAFYNQSRFTEALPLFREARARSLTFPYQFNYAVCLLKSGMRNECSAILQDIVKDKDYSPETAKALLLLCSIYADEKKTDVAKEIADDLFQRDYFNTLDIGHAELADLMYLVGNDEISVMLYERDNLYPSDTWLGPYFYSLKQTDQAAKAKMKMDEVVKELIEMISEIEEDQKDDPSKWLQGDSDTYISTIQNEISSIKSCYNAIFSDGQKPVIQRNPQLAHICYYINCPRHSQDLML